nr:hypothetical protein [Tanacetum cinerariifolium]
MRDEEALPDPWILFTDGSSCIDSSGADLIITNPEGMEFTYALRFRHDQILGKVEKEVLAVVEEEGRTWMTPIHEYLVEEILPEEKKKARAIRHKAKRPFPEGPGKVKFLIVAFDYFTKWREAKPVATITGAQIKKFMWDNIVCRFGLPGEIISDNGKQFRDNPFKDWYEKLCIRQCFDFVKHPQASGLVERENSSLEIGMPTLRTAKVDMINNDEALGINLDLLEEKREQAAIQEAKEKPKWKNTIILGFVTQSLGRQTLSTETTKQAMQKKEASSDLSGKDRMKS